LEALAEQHRETTEKKKAVDEELRETDRQKTEHTKLKERLASGEKEVQTLTLQKTQVVAKVDGLAKLEPEFRALEAQAATLPARKQQFELLRQRKAEADRLRTEEKFVVEKAAGLKAAEDKARVKLLALDRDAARVQAIAAEIARDLTLGTVTTTGLETAVAACEEKIQHTSGTLSAQQNRLEAEHKKVSADFEAIKTAGPEGTCPLCRQKLGTHFAEIGKEFEDKLRGIEDEALEVLRGVEEIVKEKEKLAAVKPKLTELRNLSAKLGQRKDTEAELAEVRKETAVQAEAQKALAKKIADLAFDPAAWATAEKELSELEKTERKYHDLRAKLAEGTHLREQLAGLETRIHDRTKELETIRKEIATSPFDEQKAAALEQKRKEIESALRTIDTGTATATANLRHAEEKIAAYRKAEAEIAGLRKKEEELTGELELLGLTRKIIASYVVYLMQVVRSRLEGEVSRIISEITSGRYEQVLLDEDFNLLVRDLDADYPVDRFSGGEQDDIAVALRIALSRYLAELHNVHESTFLIFDEIFGSQDEERRNNLLATLRTQESRFPQILLISHIPEIQGEFANTLVVEMGPDQASRIREVQ
ncbi:MAG TPA: hypothetical protein VEI81_00140, partial [Methanoregula sp.]|nr:hypothetical protein [Methanoregula sp.]